MMIRCRKFFPFLLAAFLFLSVSYPGQEEEDKTLRLPIGDAKLKGKEVQIAADEIVSARSGKPTPFARMIQEMKDSRFVYVGESHDNLTMHDIQFRVIQALHQRDRNIAVGLEMLPVDVQPVLDKWSQGLLTEDEFLRDVRWYVHWNMNFGYYQKIFAFAKDNQIPVFALNVPRDVITRIRMRGWEALSEEDKALVPKPDVSWQDHRTLIRTIFESAELPHQMKGEGLDKVFEGLYRAQAAWDQVMAANTVRGAELTGKRMVVLAGSGHLLYNLGINGRVFEKNRLPFKTVVAVSLSSQKTSLPVARALADYIWGVPEEERPHYPAVGLAFKTVEGMANLVLERKPIDGVALGGDFDKGDIVLAIDGRAFSDINEARMYLARFQWGEETKIRLLRNGDVKEVVLKFVEAPPESKEKPSQEEKTPADRMKMALASKARMEKLERQIQAVIRGAEGEVGVIAKHLESGDEISVNGSSSYPMASVFKLPVLVEILAQVKEGKFRLEDEISIQNTDQHLGSGILADLTAPGVRLSVRNLVQLMMMISDNSAADILLEKVGAENVNRRLKQFGIDGISVNRTCQELIMDFVGLDYEKFRGLSLDQVAAEYRKMGGRSPEAFKTAVEAFNSNPEDQSTPQGMTSLLEKIFRKEILDPESCELILSIMLECQTGEARIRAGLPRGTPLAHKTGTIAGTVNDTGIITLPDDQGHVALTVFTKGFLGKTSEVEDMIARIARFVYDYFYFTN
jgi:beta-lactamase class A